MNMIKVTNSTEETMQIAYNLAQYLKKADFIALYGDLSAGKTTFTKGLASGLGINQIVNSPTFTILKIYRDGSIPLFHIDAYRLKDNDYDLGLNEDVEDGITVVEWPEFYSDLGSDFLAIKFEFLNDNARKLIFEPHGQRYIDLLKEIS